MTLQMHTVTEPPSSALALSRVDTLPLLLAIGIIGYSIMGEEPSWWILLAVPLWGGIAVLHRHQPPMRDGALAVVIMVIGMMAAAWQTEHMDSPRIPDRWKPWEVTGEVINASPDDGKARLLVAVQSIEGLVQKELPQYVRVSLRGRAALPQAGDTVRLRAVLYPPSPPLIPGGFDFARYFYFRGIGAVGYALPPVTIVKSRHEHGLSTQFSRMRFTVQDWLLAHIPQPAAGITVALLTGDTTPIDEKTAQAFRVSGLAHILSISGMHMGIVCGMMFVLLRTLLSAIPPLSLRLNVKKISAMVALVMGVAYLALADFPIPAVRAYVMVAFFFAGVMLDREALTIRSLVWAAVVILLAQPSSVLEPGFQMSFAATVALVVAYRHFAASRFGNSWEERSWWKRVGVYFTGIAFSSLVASAATAPFAAYHFNQFVAYSVLANLMALPLLSFLIMPMLLAALLLWPVGASAYPLMLAGWGTQQMVKVALWIESMPGAAWYIPPVTPEMFCLAAAGMLLVLFAPRLWRGAGLVLALAALGSAAFYTPPDILVADDGKALAVRVHAEQDEWVLVRGKSNRNFTVEMWQQRLGVTMHTFKDWSKDKQGAQVLRCDEVACIWQTAERAFVFPERGKVLVQWGAGEKQAIRWPDLDHKGAHAVWLHSGKKPEVVTGCDGETTSRPWTGCYHE